MKSIDNAESKSKSLINLGFSGSWVKWFHAGIPDEPEVVRQAVRVAAVIQGHCLACTGISGCYFMNINEKKCPKHPHHSYCHCKKQLAVTPFVKAFCDIRKFTEYIFAEKYVKNGKSNLFTHLGFTIYDSKKLKDSFENQASKQYALGNYILGKLDNNGQRMNIEISLTQQNGKIVKFVSGWMIRPNGYITCNTPLGG